MNGPTNGKLALDSNIVINFFNKKIAAPASADDKLLRLSCPGLQTLNIA